MRGKAAEGEARREVKAEVVDVCNIITSIIITVVVVVVVVVMAMAMPLARRRQIIQFITSNLLPSNNHLFLECRMAQEDSQWAGVSLALLLHLLPPSQLVNFWCCWSQDRACSVVLSLNSLGH